MELKHAFYTTPTLLGTLLVQIIALVLLVVFISGCGVTGVKPLTGTTLPMPINHTDTLADLRQEVATLQTEISACTEKDTAKKQFLETRLERILAAIEKKESAAVSYGETPDEET